MAEVIDFERAKQKKEPLVVNSELNERRREAIKQLPRYRGEVPSKNTIRGLPDVKVGEIFWVESDNKAYIVAEKDRKKMTIKALDETATISTGVTIYEMNKRLVSKEPLFNWDDEEVVGKLKERLWEWFNEDTSDRFYMMYGRDLHYVTLFEVKSRLTQKNGLIAENELDLLDEMLQPVGNLISMDFNTSDGEMAIEIWVRTKDSDAELLYLFPYDKGVVKI